MNTPGFTAEASLFKGDMSYQATAEATVYGGFVQPAIFDVSTPLQAGISDLFTTKFPPYCHLEYICRIYGYGQPFQLCFWGYVCSQV